MSTMVAPMMMGARGGFELMNDLHSASKQDNVMAVARLIKEGYHVDKRDPYG